MQLRENIAAELCDHLFPDAGSEATLVTKLENPSEVAFLTRYLNGPGADQVMAAREFRWISIHADDLATVRSLADLRRVCTLHIEPDRFGAIAPLETGES